MNKLLSLFKIFKLHNTSEVCGGGGLGINFSENLITENLFSWFGTLNRFKNQNYITHLKNKGESVFDYKFLMSLNSKDYAYYLCQAYLIKTGQKLNLKNPKTLTEKIQWLKIYDNLPIKAQLTDKILVRDYVKEKIGEEHLKPVLWIGDKFDDIPFDSLPKSFIIKANHGCKWHYIVENKEKFLQTSHLIEHTKDCMENWLKQSFFGWSDFETQYLNIKPKIFIEPLLREKLNEMPQEIEIWYFNGKPKITQEVKFSYNYREETSFDENFNNINLRFTPYSNIIKKGPDNLTKQAVNLSNKLAENFKLVRIDWIVYKNCLYFGELTFTPHSGFIVFDINDINWNRKLGKMLNLKGD